MRNNKAKLLFHLFPALISVVLSLFVGAVFLALWGYNPVEVYSLLVSFGLGRSDSLGTVLFYATPLIFSGLAVAVGMKGGMLNIGVEGQYLLGAFCAAWVSFGFAGLPGWIHFPLAVTAGWLGGSLWSFLPVYLKVKRGVHEVISTIMMNYVAASLLHWLIADVFMDRNQQLPAGIGNPIVRTPIFSPEVSAPPIHGLLALFGLEVPRHVAVNVFFLVGVLLAIICWILFQKTAFGLDVRATGQGLLAARNSGIRVGRVQFTTFLISGGIAGLVGLSHLLGYYDSMDLDFPRSFGFVGIAVALLANSNFIAVVPAALLMGLLARGGEGIQTFLSIPMEWVVIFQAMIIFSVAFALRWANRKLMRRQSEVGSSDG